MSHDEGSATPENARPGDAMRAHQGDACSVGCTRGALACVVLGVAIRVIRYALRFPLWGDEAALAFNVMERSYIELLLPLTSNQVAPPLFLWIERACVESLGFHEYSLRLFPLVCGVGGLVVFWRLAATLFPAPVCLASVAVLAVSHYPIRHSCEVKPYATDLFVATVLCWIAARFWRSRHSAWLWSFGVCGALGVLLSLPSVFVAGGLSLATLAIALRESDWSMRVRFVAANGLIAAAFYGIVVWMDEINRHQVGAVMRDFWATAFPPADWLGAPLWLVSTLAGDALAYPIGGENGASILTALAVAVGCVASWRSGMRTPVVALVGTVALAVVAAALHKYPLAGTRACCSIWPRWPVCWPGRECAAWSRWRAGCNSGPSWRSRWGVGSWAWARSYTMSPGRRI